ncbi:MAG: tetratricopeptide repeat protein [Saprospiraceae bacterium]|uniref:Tetratricopeptide repeat protein n=1 Tax=Candidatus Opimibacter skivensis TaxID=2982028 RepID=A0A9D7SWT5_9BACT|nr:tetratricopeptide repeat protein [Candidatus Opimibacter skivensis]
MKSFLVSIFFVSIACCVHAASASKELNTKAALLYSEGKYAEALEIWNGLVSSGNTDPNLYFNIGSAESLLGHVPESILAFEKAKRLKPGDDVISEAIKQERAKIDNAVIPVGSFFLIEGYRDFLAIFRPGGWVLMALLFGIIALWQWLVSIKAVENYIHIPGKKYWYCAVTGIFCVLIGFLSYHQLHKDDEAIVMTTCECRKAASAESPINRILNPGEKVRKTDRISDWNKVSLLNLDECWIKTGCLKPVEIGSR